MAFRRGQSGDRARRLSVRRVGTGVEATQTTAVLRHRHGVVWIARALGVR